MELKDMCKFARQHVKEGGATQSDFAAMVGTNQTEISFIERGFIPESQQKINKIIRLYNECLNNRNG